MVTTRSSSKKRDESESCSEAKPHRERIVEVKHTAGAERDHHEGQALRQSTDILQAMHALLSPRAKDSTVCPSEIARKLHNDDVSRYPDWRVLMDSVRDEVWKAVEIDQVQVTQGGKVRDLEDKDNLKGPIRVRKGPEWQD
ncbi:hypothetical protein BD324DRAFT_652555 [Kockovaella imperatae]|uniref:Uncharacterized protein n=1 Tax=Kockovaella imperatae TaxID=4999 RepID=A0A1Y1UD29_9TREE|nr:hypothetical protein BD324DRAFT_652555 [Kockovaella imperatae]ORX35426.1 hypothetical protein BD324DRAFT_652555 [Kockovaella imperatae]